MILWMSLGEPGFSIFLPSYLGFESTMILKVVIEKIRSLREQPNLPEFEG
jgi:hypothetical protein